MDLLKNSSKYHDYLQRIQEYKEIADNNQAFSVIEERVNNLYQELKSSHQKNYYKNIYKGISFLALTLSFTCMFSSYYALGVLNLLLLIGAFFYYKYAVRAHAHESKREQDLVHKSESFESRLLHTLNYLENGVDLKSARIIAVRFIFIGLFSVMMFTAAKLLNMENSTSSVVLYGISLLINASFWFYFFKDDLEELEYISMELEEYKVSFESSISEESNSNEDLEEGASAQKVTDFYNLESDEPIEIISTPPTENSQQKEFKQLKLELK